MLGLDSKDMPNHVIEIGTGEGKSITLAITGLVLALAGFEVDCVCYSRYPLVTPAHLSPQPFTFAYSLASLP